MAWTTRCPDVAEGSLEIDGPAFANAQAVDPWAHEEGLPFLLQAWPFFEQAPLASQTASAQTAAARLIGP